MCLSVVAFLLLLFLFSLYHVTRGVLADQHREPATQLSIIGFYPELFPVQVTKSICPNSPFPEQTHWQFLSERIMGFEVRIKPGYKIPIYELLCSHRVSVSISCFHSRCKLNSCKQPPRPCLPPKKKRLPRQIIPVAWAVSRKPFKTCSLQKSTLCALQDC